MSNLIDFKAALSKRNNGQSGQSNSESNSPNTSAQEGSKEAAVIPLTTHLVESNKNYLETNDRRKKKRTVLTDFISVQVVVPGVGLVKAVLYDINEKGISFDLDHRLGHFHPSEEIALRLYLNHNTYFPMVTMVKHITSIEEELVYRHGSEFVTDSLNSLALHHLVKFLETVNMSLVIDRGDLLGTKQNS